MLPNRHLSPTGIRPIFLLYIALLMGQILFSMVIIFLITQPDKVLKDGSDYPFLGLLVVFLAGGAAWYVNNLRTASIGLIRANLAGKLLHYRTSIALRSAMVEAGNLFCLVLAFLENSLMPLIFFCLGLGVFLYFRPRLDEVVSLYRLNGDEQMQLERELKNRA